MSAVAEQVVIRWRRYGKGGRYRAECPEGWTESGQLHAVAVAAEFYADEHRLPVRNLLDHPLIVAGVLVGPGALEDVFAVDPPTKEDSQP